jgi:hypothetical protein
MTRISEKELLEHIKAYNDQIVDIAEKTAEQVQVLRDATEVVNSQKDSHWVKYRVMYLPLFFVSLLVVFLVIFRQLDYCKITFDLSELRNGGIERCK